MLPSIHKIAAFAFAIGIVGAVFTWFFPNESYQEMVWGPLAFPAFVYAIWLVAGMPDLEDNTLD